MQVASPGDERPESPDDADWYALPLEAPQPTGVFLKKGASDHVTDAIRHGDPAPFRHYAYLLELAAPGARIVDLGAHLGTFSLFAAAHGFHVLAVEASPLNAALLRASVKKNRCSTVTVVECAVSDQPGTLGFLQDGPYGQVVEPSAPSAIEVESSTVDLLIDRHGWTTVDLIKMDIEGSETRAIKGMTRTLAAPSPAILFESNGHTLHLCGSSVDELLGTLEAQGFSCYSISEHWLVPCHAGRPQYACVVDCIALRSPLPTRLDEALRPSPDVEDQVQQVLAAASSENSHLRGHLARSLPRAPWPVLLDQRVAVVLSSLSDDADPSVRDAVSWWRWGAGALGRRCER